MKTMTKAFQSSISHVLFLVIAAMCLGPGAARNVFAQQGGPCADDIAKFCKGLQPGGGAIAKCLMENENSLSAACKDFMAEAKQKVQDFADACRGDLDKFCKGVKPGGGAIAKCLKENENSLSPACKERVSKIEEKVRDFKEACRGDVDRFCKDVQPGKGGIVRCLKGHEAELSPGCKEQMTK